MKPRDQSYLQGHRRQARVGESVRGNECCGRVRETESDSVLDTRMPNIKDGGFRI